jgi:hypothetical protein
MSFESREMIDGAGCAGSSFADRWEAKVEVKGTV